MFSVCAWSCMFLAVVAGTDNVEKKGEPGPIAIGNFTVLSMGGVVSVNCPDIEKHVQKFGSKGWLQGLKDTRSLRDIVGPTATDEDLALSIRQKREGGKEDWLRVKDLFYAHLCRVLNLEKDRCIRVWHKQEDRDRMIERAVRLFEPIAGRKAEQQTGTGISSGVEGLKISADARWQDSSFNNDPQRHLVVSLLVIGPAAAKASACGNIEIDSIRGENGEPVEAELFLNVMRPIIRQHSLLKHPKGAVLVLQR